MDMARIRIEDLNGTAELDDKDLEKISAGAKDASMQKFGTIKSLPKTPMALSNSGGLGL